MKTMALILGLAGLMSLASCKKEWVCQCTDNNNNNTYHDVPNATLNDANRTCNEFEYNNQVLGTYNNCSIIE